MTMKEAAEKLTKQEAAKKLKTLCHACDRYPQCVNNDPICFKSLEMAIKALEQQPCEDAISRSEAIRVASGYCHWANIPKELAKLPSVTPQQKTGRWIVKKTGSGHDKKYIEKIKKEEGNNT